MNLDIDLLFFRLILRPNFHIHHEWVFIASLKLFLLHELCYIFA